MQTTSFDAKSPSSAAPRVARSLSWLFAATAIGLSAPLRAAIELTPVVPSGLSSPVFVGNAGDGSNRLFIVEAPGAIRVLAPGARNPTVFLDLQGKVTAGGEQGLLGLAFHPRYRSNGRFFVYYTRPGGAIVIAEYRVSASNPDAANPAETVLLTIPHPVNANHNGGMLAFGPDGYLYIGVGDGGSGNDPPNNAQNTNVLLGKILRIDVDPPVGAGVAYRSPEGNPFVGAGQGLPEIFAYGLRNPWRFSFDRGGTHAQWVADVGQGAREEVNTPIVSGGNYGWRVYEGTACTSIDPQFCNASNYRFPIFEYTHTNGRCSITGGYVYRGRRGALPAGTYIYADYCTGEIMAWDGSTQKLLLGTGMNISSFGEDEDGELYVVNLGGAISRIDAAGAATQVAVEYHYEAWDHYFITAFPDEIARLDGGAFGGDWRRTGQTFRVWTQAVPQSLATCRFFSTSFAPRSAHFYTPDVAECAKVRSNPDWQFEAIAFDLRLPDAAGVCAPPTVALYRLYNDGMGGAPNHRYTTSLPTLQQMVAAGWRVEGNGVTGAFACVP